MKKRLVIGITLAVFIIMGTTMAFGSKADDEKALETNQDSIELINDTITNIMMNAEKELPQVIGVRHDNEDLIIETLLESSNQNTLDMASELVNLVFKELGSPYQIYVEDKEGKIIN